MALTKLNAAQRAARDELAQRMRDIIARQRLTVTEAGRALDLKLPRAKAIARLYGIQSHPIARIEAEAAGRAASAKNRAEAAAARKRAKRKADAEARARAAAPNPRLSAAQNANIAKGKDRIRALFASIAKHGPVPPPPREEADRLVAEYIAKHGVTRCPPCAPPETPHNSGVGWGKGR